MSIFTLIFSFFIVESRTEDYHPDTCLPIKYVFAIIKEERIKIHGLWIEVCEECTSCGYPTWCNMKNFSFLPPKETQFIDTYWVGKDKESSEELFKHEVMKHSSCMRLSSDEYLYLVTDIFFGYLEYIQKSCNRGCYIILDKNFALLKVLFWI